VPDVRLTEAEVAWLTQFQTSTPNEQEDARAALNFLVPGGNAPIVSCPICGCQDIYLLGVAVLAGNGRSQPGTGGYTTGRRIRLCFACQFFDVFTLDFALANGRTYVTAQRLHEHQDDQPETSSTPSVCSDDEHVTEQGRDD